MSYKPYQAGRILFQVSVNQKIANTGLSSDSMQDWEDYKYPSCVLQLPKSYVSDGRRTKVIMLCHGLSSDVNYEEWGNNGATFNAMIAYFNDCGYAVFDTNGARPTTDTDPVYKEGRVLPTIGAPKAVEAYNKAFEWVRDNYNVYDKVYVLGASQGGLCAWNYTFTYPHKVAAIGLFAGFSNLKLQAWENLASTWREYFGEYYGFNNPIVTYEDEKTIGSNPVLRINAEGKCFLNNPTKFWVGANDDAHFGAQGKRMIDAIQLSGGIAYFRVISGAGHEIAGGANLVANEELILWFNRF